MKKIFATVLTTLLIISFGLQTAFAVSDLGLTGSNSFTGSSNVAMPITDLQISGTTPGTTPVKLYVASGTLAMSTTTGLTFTGPSTGSTLYFSGTIANINTALATLTYTRGSVGSDTLEVSLVNSGEVFYPSNGHLYKFITSTTDWNGAFAAASGQTAYGATGYLATITSSGENSFISGRLTADGWIGASDSATEGDWKWVTGDEAGVSFWTGLGNGHTVGIYNYANWNSGEPNDSGGNEDCAEYYSGSGMWNDLPCSGNNLSGYVVEFGKTGDMPTVVAKNIAITTLDVAPPSAVTFGTATTTTLGLSWTSGGGSETNFLIEKSQSDCTGSFSQIASISSSLTTYTATGLSPETQYCFRVRSTNGSANSAYATTTTTTPGIDYDFTLPNTPLKPTISNLTTTSLQVGIPDDGNPTATGLRSLYSIQELSSLLWLQYPNGSLGGSEGFTGSPAWNSNTLTGLTPNSPYSFRTRITKRNSGGGYSSYSPTSDIIYTLTSTPNNLIATTPDNGTVVLTWGGDGTSYIASNDTNGIVASTSNKNNVFTRLNCETDYTFSVKGLNHDGIESAYSSSVSIRTGSCPHGGGGLLQLMQAQELARQQTLATNTISVGPTPPVTNNAIPFGFARDLRITMTGDDVNALQRMLVAKNIGPASQKLANNGTTKYFGILTKNALIEYQKTKPLQLDGIFGPKTRATVTP